MMNGGDLRALDADYARDYGSRIDDLTPEPLFESHLLPSPKLCLRCGARPATSILYTTLGMRPVLPLCGECAVDWNVGGYRILKGIKPAALLWQLLKYKLAHPFRAPSILSIKSDLSEFQRWAKKMRTFEASR
jgi:hypothetical protein